MKSGVYSKLRVVLQSLEIAVLIKKHICWKVKIRTESNRGKKYKFDCNVTKIDVRQSDYHFADRDKLYEAPNQGFGRQFSVPTHTELLVCSFLSLSKAKKNSMGVLEKGQLWFFFFYIDCKNLDASLLFASRAKKTPDICLLWSFTAESTLLRSCRTSQ